MQRKILEDTFAKILKEVSHEVNYELVYRVPGRMFVHNKSPSADDNARFCDIGSHSHDTKFRQNVCKLPSAVLVLLHWLQDVESIEYLITIIYLS